MYFHVDPPLNNVASTCMLEHEISCLILHTPLHSECYWSVSRARDEIECLANSVPVFETCEFVLTSYCVSSMYVCLNFVARGKRCKAFSPCKLLGSRNVATSVDCIIMYGRVMYSDS